MYVLYTVRMYVGSISGSYRYVQMIHIYTVVNRKQYCTYGYLAGAARSFRSHFSQNKEVINHVQARKIHHSNIHTLI